MGTVMFPHALRKSQRASATGHARDYKKGRAELGLFLKPGVA